MQKPRIDARPDRALRSDPIDQQGDMPTFQARLLIHLHCLLVIPGLVKIKTRGHGVASVVDTPLNFVHTAGILVHPF